MAVFLVGDGRGVQPKNRSGEVEVFVERGENGADAALVAGFAGHSVEEEGDGEFVGGVGEGDGALVAAVPEGGGGAVGPVTIGDGVGAVVVVVGDEAEAPVEGVAEGLVEGVGAVAAGEFAEGVGLEERRGVVAAKVDVEEGLVESGKVEGRAAAVAAGAGEGDDVGTREEAVGFQGVAGSAIDGSDGVFGLLGEWDAESGVCGADGLEDVFADHVLDRATGDLMNKFAENRPRRVDVITGGFARHPILLQRGLADSLDGGFGCLIVPVDGGISESAGVGEEVTDGDRGFAVGREVGEVSGDRGIEFQGTDFDLLGDGGGGEGFNGGHPEHGFTGVALSESDIREEASAPEDGELGALVGLADAGFDGVSDFWPSGHTRLLAIPGVGCPIQFHGKFG